VQTADLDGYEKIVPKLFAISEIGLDKFHPDFLKQTDIFKKQLLLAERYGKVVVVHSVKSHNETTNILSHHKGKKIIHSFIGNLSIANRYIEIGCRLSFSPQSLSSPKTVDALQGCCLNDIFIETDTSNMPIEEIYTKIASYKSCLVEDLKEAITNNFKNTFYEL
ncbi:MAG: TatD family hydrolase, partial [Rikenellaceae bacterium]